MGRFFLFPTSRCQTMSFLKNSLRYLLLIVLLAAIVLTAISTRSAWLPLLNPNAAGSEIDRPPPDDRQAREAIVQGIQAFYAFDSQTGKAAWRPRCITALPFGYGMCRAEPLLMVWAGRPKPSPSTPSAPTAPILPARLADQPGCSSCRPMPYPSGLKFFQTKAASLCPTVLHHRPW